MRRAIALLATTAACSSPASRTPAASDFAALAQAATDHLLQLEPADAISLGIHTADGTLPDRTAAGIASEIAVLSADRDKLAAIDPRTLTPVQRDERDVVLQADRTRLFSLVDLDELHTNPMAYAPAINLDAYVVRDYAPVATRAAALTRVCTALPAFLAQARANLTAPIPRTWIDTALLQTRGLADFADHDAREALAANAAPPLAAALDTCKSTLLAHADWLEQQRPRATDAFALGPDKLLRMLAETQGVTTDLAHLQAIADADLARNTAALTEAAHAIDPSKPVADVVTMLAGERPTPANVVEVATNDAADLRAFILANHIVSLAPDEVALVKPSPPFQRWNSAFLDGPGPFETVKMPSFFYISPPDPTWPAADQASYLPPTADLVFTTVHEVYPGHFVHGLHIRANPSRVLRSFCTYSTSEGWAHYAEEMMFDAGASGSSPRARIGMLKEALLRDVRFEVALGEHAHGMSVEAATKLFVERGFVDAANAKQQAVRGTFDPMFLSYTLGKLMIRQLHTDYTAAHAGATLGQFHDAFLDHACAPIPVIRRDLLDNDSSALP